MLAEAFEVSLVRIELWGTRRAKGPTFKPSSGGNSVSPREIM